MSTVTAHFNSLAATAGAAQTLADVPLHVAATVVAVHEPGATGERLLEMGLTPGTRVTVVRRGLFGDPLQVSVRGYMLSLRRAQARAIVIQRME